MDKLVELDMGMALATQMASSMNQTIHKQKDVPRVWKAMPSASSADIIYYVVLDAD